MTYLSGFSSHHANFDREFTDYRETRITQKSEIVEFDLQSL